MKVYNSTVRTEYSTPNKNHVLNVLVQSYFSSKVRENKEEVHE